MRWSDARETIVPGHGRPLEPEQATRLLDEDVAYLEALARGRPGGAPAPGPANGHATPDPRRKRAAAIYATADMSYSGLATAAVALAVLAAAVAVTAGSCCAWDAGGWQKRRCRCSSACSRA